MEWLCGFVVGVLALAVVGHLIWLAGAALLTALFGPRTPEPRSRPPRAFRYCPACGADTDERDADCPACDLDLDGRLAHDLHRVRVAEREVRALADRAQIDRDTADLVLGQLETRARSLRGLPAHKPGARPRAKPVASPPVAPADAVEVDPPTPAEAALLPTATPLPRSEPVAALTDALVEPLPPAPPPVPEDLPAAPEPAEPAGPRPPKRRRSNFLEEHNILWGELVGGLLIVGCSIALVVTLRQTLEAIPYFRFLLSAGVTLGLFGAGQYTLHRWKLTGTSRGMLVIALLLAPLTLLLLADPFTQGTQGAFDVAVKLAAVAAFVGVVRTGGRDLIGTEHLPGPIDRRWLLSLAVVGAAGTQLLPAATASAWLPLVCFGVACTATLGGLTWYHPHRRTEPVSDKSGTALLMFVGLSAFALLAAWGLYLVRAQEEVAARLHALALPLALAGVPVVEAGVLVLRRVTSSVGLRTLGTAVALVGFLSMTTGLALAWPDPLTVLLVAAAAGAFLTRVAFRERLPWVQAGALPLLAFAAVVGFHGALGNWTVGAETSANDWLRGTLDSSESGAVLAGFALVLGLVAEVLARHRSRQTAGYACGALAVGAFALVLVSTHGIARPAPAAFAHAALAVGLLASNVRWKRRALAHGGFWLALGGTLWALWWLAPNQFDRWGFVVAVEALLLAVGAVALRGTHGPATALLRRAARDVAFAGCLVAVVVAVPSRTLLSEWHTGTLFALALAGFALARLTGWPPLTWVGSVAALLGLVHLSLYTLDGKPETLALETAILAHAALATLAAVACRRQARVFGDPLRWAARISSVLAVPLLFFPPAGLAWVSALLAVWLGWRWLTFVLLWRERGAFSLFQGALTLAGLLVAFSWIERQPWWGTTTLFTRDPRALHAYGVALAVLALVWALARRALRPSRRARELWCDDPLSLDRFALGATVIGFLLLAAIAVVPGTRAELTPAGLAPLVDAPRELAHAFDPAAWWLLALLAGAVLLSWRLSKVERDTAPHALGLALLMLAAPVVWAGTHAGDVATASALRWGLAVAFVAGSTAVALRVPIRRAATAAGFAVQPSPDLRPWLLVLFAFAAGVVVVVSGQVAEIGLNGSKSSGPAEASIFAQMGAMASNLVPLALVVFGLAVTAGRERSSGYAFAGGLVFVATVTAGYALGVVTSGGELDRSENVHLWLVFASGAAVWAALWLATESHVPGGVLLAIQARIGLFALAWVALAAGVMIVAHAEEAGEPPLLEFGRFGWAALALAAGVAVWRGRRAEPGFTVHALALTGAVAGVLTGCALQRPDAADQWLPFHGLALAWVAVGAALLAALNRGPMVAWWLAVFATLVIACVGRSVWFDPWRAWLPAGLALSAAGFYAGVALRLRHMGFVCASALAVNLTAACVWVVWWPDVPYGFALANAAAFAVALGAWSAVRIRQHAAGGGIRWLDSIDIAIIPAFVLLLMGVAPALGEAHAAPHALTWGAVGAVALACAVRLWDRYAAFARPGLYAAGVLAVLLGVASADARAVWDVPAASLALAAFVLGVACLALAVSRRTTPLLRMPDRGAAWPWLLAAQALVGAGVVLFGMRIGLTDPDLLARVANPIGVALLAAAVAVLVRAHPEPGREALRTAAVAHGVLTLAALAWSVPDPTDRFAWLHRNAWLFVALAAAAVGGTEGAARFGTDWLAARRRVAGWAAGAALAVLCLHLLQQVPAFDPESRRTPLTREESVAVLVGIAALFVLALRFALKPGRDPFALPPARRTAYVYLAEVLIVLFFMQIRFNVPGLFRGDLAKMWTFAVMALAYAGIGLAELFERKKIDVLAVPLRRTGVLLPLVPLLAFWAKPPGVVTEFARDSAPGLGPLLGYLEKLPQHFDTYAWLWFLAGGVYALVALSKKSFGWALLAALATNAAMWSLLAHHEVPFAVHPQAWVIPLALIVLASEHINRRRLSADASNGMRYAGVAMIYVASAADMFLAGVGNSMWLPVVLAVLCVIGVLSGILLRVRAFVYLGVGFLLLDLFSMIWYAAVDLEQTWVWYVSGIVLGVVVLALFAYLEKRRNHGERPAEGE